MFCIALVLLLQCLFGSSGYTFKATSPAGSSEFVQVDLFESLNLHNSSYPGLSLGVGIHTLSPGVVFAGDRRETMITGDSIDRILSHMSKLSVNEFTVSAIVKQNPNNVGTLLAFSKGLLSALEIQSSGRKNELRVISGSKIETFPFRLADGNWHKVAISFSASQADIFIDCTPAYRRALKFDPALAVFDSRNVSVWIGQRTTSHFLYQGMMQDLRITFGPYGYLSQCPQADSSCPTCSEYTALKLSFASLQSQIQKLTERLSSAEARLHTVEQCDCMKACQVNETMTKSDGASWYDGCDVCICKKGEIHCSHKPCPAIDCKHPVQPDGECCPTCLKSCQLELLGDQIYDHGEVVTRKCLNCTCVDGSMECIHIDEESCPILDCPTEQQIIVAGECCRVCSGTNYCEANTCHPNANCTSLDTKFICHCKTGFLGDGFECVDEDECLSNKHHCDKNSRCVNTIGSFTCQCNPGFRKVLGYQCEDVDECAPGASNKCHRHATCVNTKGSHFCICNPGYTGNGIDCSPICNSTCENGGICVAPDTCSCRSGWTGYSCETDIDECRRDNSSVETGPLCPENAVCVNKPGWYLCQCKDGFQASLDQSGQARCQDVDECELSPCSSRGMKCVNTPGSFECHCPDDKGDCSIGCFQDGKLYESGSIWFNKDCNEVCTCLADGVVDCKAGNEPTCLSVCSLMNSTREDSSTDRCCSNCTKLTTPMELRAPKQKTCRHQSHPQLYHQSGEMWHHRCQTCECLDGEIDCWPIDCPPVTCDNPFLPQGDCCLRCPQEVCSHRHANNTECLQNALDMTVESVRILHERHHQNCITCKCQVPLCAKSVSKNDGICVLRMEISVVLTTTIALVLARNMLS